jgi:hypothetical protein
MDSSMAVQQAAPCVLPAKALGCVLFSFYACLSLDLSSISNGCSCPSTGQLMYADTAAGTIISTRFFVQQCI